uniref:Uncharacterized protein n=1 Tax=Glossina morsitans morsitans TaxID=37546 RepID=A0A1B0GB67_GLOMM
MYLVSTTCCLVAVSKVAVIVNAAAAAAAAPAAAAALMTCGIINLHKWKTSMRCEPWTPITTMGSITK